MRKILFVLVVLCASCSVFSMTGFTYLWTIADGDTVTKTKWKANNDSVLNWAGRAGDTINNKVGWANAAKDSTYWRAARLTKSNIDFTLTADSVSARAMGGTIKGDTAYFLKGIKSPLFDGAVKGNVTGVSDSSTGSVRAAKLTTARTISGTSFDGSANVTIIPDSAKGAHHLNGGVVNADTFNCHGTVIQKNGNVGIGKTSPGSILDIAKSTPTESDFQIMRFLDGPDLVGGIKTVLYNGNTGNAFQSGFKFQVNNTNETLIDAMTIDYSGNVGIGTIRPVSPLTVKGNFVDTGNGRFTGTLTADSAYFTKIGISGTFVCSLTTGFTSVITGTCRYTKVGSLVSIVFPVLQGTSNTNLIVLHNLPGILKPSSSAPYNISVPICVENNGAGAIGYMIVSFTGNDVYIVLPPSDFTTSGEKGICSISGAVSVSSSSVTYSIW